MTKTINKIFVVLAFAVIAYGAFSYFAQPVSIIETAHAAFGGESGNGGCCGGENGSNQGGGDHRDDPLPPICEYLKADKTSLPAGGGNVTLSWATNNGVSARLIPDNSTVPLNGSKTVSVTSDTTFILKVFAGSNQSDQCQTTVKVEESTPVPKCESFTATPNKLPYGGGNVTLTWDTSNASNVKLDGENVSLDGSKTVFVNADKTFVLLVNNGDDSCNVTVDVEDKADEPRCEISANPMVIKKGQSSTLTWSSNKVFAATIDKGVGNVDPNGSVVVSPLETTVYTFTGKFGEGDYVTCPVTVTVTEDPAPDLPICDSFTATPNSFTNGVGGGVTLTWATTNADSVTIDQGIGAVSEDGSIGTAVTDNTTFTLTAVRGDKSVSCPVTVTVTNPETPTLSCDSFTASPTLLPRGGGETVLTWETTGATNVSIDNGVGTVAVDGSTSVRVNNNTTFTLTIRDDKGNTKSCEASVIVSTGGGGGSPSPRCELTISDTKIKPGEEITISWNNTRTNNMVLKDNRGNVLIDTEKTTNYDEDEGSIKIKPIRDTEYTMTVSRGSRDRDCRVKVEMEDDVTVISNRTQTPQVAGISLTQVPYTGFEAGPFLTLLFYSLLAVWAAFIAYIIAVKERTVTNNASFGGTNARNTNELEIMFDNASESVEKEKTSISSSTIAAEPFISPIMHKDSTPVNLPTGEVPIVGYKSFVEKMTPVSEDKMDVMTELENAAHQKQTLLSSDAVNYFMEKYDSEGARLEALSETIEKAKVQFPREDGWIVLNLARIHKLNDKTEFENNPDINVVPDTRVGVNSLAEAILAGNVASAYSLIGNRPMFSLADAAADLDAVYRARKGISTEVSSLLVSATAGLSDEQIENMIKALTSALDGAYTDEESAVKMAIMKAIKIVA